MRLFRHGVSVTNSRRGEYLSCRSACRVPLNLVDPAHVRREVAHIGRRVRTARTRVQFQGPLWAPVDGAAVPRETELGGKEFRTLFARVRGLHVDRADVGRQAVGGDEALAAVVALEIAMVLSVELKVPPNDTRKVTFL